MFNANLSLHYLKTNVFACLFLLWWLTLPFGSSILSVDLGPIVLYPQLILSFLLGILGLKSIKDWGRSSFLYLGFVLLWLIQGFVQYCIQPKTDLALFDLKSLIYQLITTGVLISSYYTLKKESFFSIVIIGGRCFVILLLFFGVFESFTGIHLVGSTTDKLLDLRIGNIHYAPLFLYDNPNDYVAHGLFYLSILFLLDKRWGRNPFLMLSCLIAMYHFAYLADSTFGKLATLILISFFVLFEVFKLKKWQIAPLAFIFIFIGIFFASNHFYVGPKYDYTTPYRLNELVDISIEDGKVDIQDIRSKYSPDELSLIVYAMDSIVLNNPNQSTSVRQALILNSLDFIKEKPFFGLGPGQYYQRHIDGKVKNYTGTVANAHCFPLELISVYGLIGWGYLVILLVVFSRILLNKSLGYERFLRFFIAGVVLAIIWMMPSGYLYLEIHRLTLPLLLLVLISMKPRAVYE